MCFRDLQGDRCFFFQNETVRFYSERRVAHSETNLFAIILWSFKVIQGRVKEQRSPWNLRSTFTLRFVIAIRCPLPTPILYILTLSRNGMFCSIHFFYMIHSSGNNFVWNFEWDILYPYVYLLKLKKFV